MMTVREAFLLLRERGIARDKQELRKWLNEGYIQAEPPVNRRVGWKISQDALNEFIHKFENGQFDDLRKKRRAIEDQAARHFAAGTGGATTDNDDGPNGNAYILQLEDEVILLRNQLRTLRREFNDLKKVLGFPILNPENTERPE